MKKCAKFHGKKSNNLWNRYIYACISNCQCIGEKCTKFHREIPTTIKVISIWNTHKVQWNFIQSLFLTFKTNRSIIIGKWLWSGRIQIRTFKSLNIYKMGGVVKDEMTEWSSATILSIQYKLVFFMMRKNSSWLISPSPSLSASSIISCRNTEEKNTLNLITASFSNLYYFFLQKLDTNYLKTATFWLNWVHPFSQK